MIVGGTNANAKRGSAMPAREPWRAGPQALRVGLWGQSGRYLLASLVALAVDFLIYAVLLGAGVIATAAGVLGYCCGLGAHYVLSARWVFKERMASPRTWLTFAKFVATGLVGLTLTAAIIAMLTNSELCGVYLAKLAAVVVAYVAVFFLRRSYVFRPA
jgi:putative flippase GtrA